MAKEDLDVIGFSGLYEFGGHINDSIHRKLQGPEGHAIFREMSTMDPMLSGAQYGFVSFAQQVPWMARPAPESGPRGEEEAKNLEDAMRDMASTTDELLSDILTMIPHGYSAFEILWKKRKGPNKDPLKTSKFKDGKYGIAALAPRRQVTFTRWDFDENGTVLGAYQRNPKTFKEVFIPIEKLAVFRVKPNQGNPEGQSLYLGSYYPYKYRTTLERVRAVGYQKDLNGMIKITMPLDYMSASASAAKRTIRANIEKQAALAHANEANYITMPPELDNDGKPTGWKFELVGTAGTRNVNINEAINDLKKDVLQPFLATFMMVGMDRVGSNSQHGSSTDVFAVAVDALLDSIEETMNRFVVEPWYELNGVPEEYRARWVHGDVQELDLATLTDGLLKMIDSGIINPDIPLDDFMRERLGVPPADEDERLMAEERARIAEEQRNEALSQVPQPNEADDQQGGGQDLDRGDGGSGDPLGED